MKIEEKELVEQILCLCEKQYRKGFQQGFYACLNEEMTMEQVDEFRFRDNYSVTEHPQTGYIESKSEFSGRLRVESPYRITNPNQDDFYKLKRLLSDYENKSDPT